MTKLKKGFTLIELLVVISIIGLLSSVVLASVSTARNKAKDSAIIQMAKQLQILMTMQYSDVGSYAGMQPSWIISNNNICRTGVNMPLSATNVDADYRDKVIEICNKVNELVPITQPNRLYVGMVSNSDLFPPTPFVSADITQSFTVIAALNSNNGNDYYCIGHNGKSSIGPWTVGGVGWGGAGCFGDVTNK